mmetsp:Transcript_24126/g.50519  ORF Transcript_24126/g.50519 Transcript_24126/m.50519 type:complete len:338 (-) Transcript_24126:102-1115(-)
MKIIIIITALRMASILALSPCHLPVSRLNLCFKDIKVLSQRNVLPSRGICLQHQYNTALQSSKPEQEASTNTIKPSHLKLNTRRRLELTNFFRLAAKAHLASLAFFAATQVMLRLKTAAKFVESLLILLPCASWKNAPNFEPLSIVNWAFHLVVHAVSLELAGGFYALMKQSTDDGEKRTYRGFFAVYALSFIQSFFTLSAHGLIGVNQGLGDIMENVFRACVRTGIFGTGLSATVGPWTLIPIFAGVSIDKIGYGNWAGRILSSFTLYKYFSTKELPSLLPYLYVAAALLGIVLKLLGLNLETNMAHCAVAMILYVIFGGMAFLLNQKIKRERVIV